MAFFDELRKNLTGVSGTVAKTSETVVKKSSGVLEIQKAKLKKVSLENELKSIYAELGMLYFENYADGDMPKEMAELCEKITACQHAISEAEQRVAALKGVVICTNCQAEVDKEACYCPKCGAEIVHVVEDAETENAEEVAEGEKEPEAAEEAEEAVEAESVEAEPAETAEADEPAPEAADAVTEETAETENDDTVKESADAE